MNARPLALALALLESRAQEELRTARRWAARETEARERKELAQSALRDIQTKITNILETTYDDR